jgi:hypothetical protein
MNLLDKLLVFKIPIPNLCILLNSIKDSLLRDMPVKSLLEKPSELLKVENFNLLNFLKPNRNSKLEFQIKIHLNKKLESLMEEDLCLLNFLNNNLNL